MRWIMLIDRSKQTLGVAGLPSTLDSHYGEVPSASTVELHVFCKMRDDSTECPNLSRNIQFLSSCEAAEPRPQASVGELAMSPVICFVRLHLAAVLGRRMPGLNKVPVRGQVTANQTPTASPSISSWAKSHNNTPTPPSALTSS